jgi:hypothetical protein
MAIERPALLPEATINFAIMVGGEEAGTAKDSIL